MQTVVHFVTAQLPRAGCIDGHVPGLIRALQAHGFDGRLVALQDSGQAALLTPNGSAPPQWSPSNHEQLQELLQSSALAHVHGAPATYARILQPLASCCPMVISPQALWLPHAWRRPSWSQRLKGLFSSPARRWRFAAGLHATNELEADYLRGLHPRVTTLAVGIDPESETAAAPDLPEPAASALRERRGLLFLGPLHPLEGLVPMLKACELVVPAAPEWHLIIAGESRGPWLKMIQPAVERRGLSDRVTFLLDPSPDLQQSLLERCEVLIQPSLLASAPLSAMRGLAHGRPCIVSEHCHMGDVSLSWAWQPQPNKQALAEVLEDVLDTAPPEHLRRGREGAAWVREHRAWPALAPDYADWYRQCLL